MAITKAEKEFWTRELKKELDERIHEYDEDIERCREIAKEKALKSLRIDKAWSKANELFDLMLSEHKVYEKIVKDCSDVVQGINEVVKDYEYPNPNYGYRHVSNVRMSFNSPGTTHNGKEIDNSWLENLAEWHFLEDVLREEGFDDLLMLKAAKDKVERGIMLATTNTQLKEFLEQFCAEMGISL